ncbi:hypothetical protein ACLOJK_030040 [Asimina triloba]
MTGCVERDGMRQRGRAVLRGMGRRGRGRWGDDGNEEDEDENPRETVVMGDRGRISPISGGMGDGHEEDEGSTERPIVRRLAVSGDFFSVTGGMRDGDEEDELP